MNTVLMRELTLLLFLDVVKESRAAFPPLSFYARPQGKSGVSNQVCTTEIRPAAGLSIVGIRVFEGERGMG